MIFQFILSILIILKDLAADCVRIERMLYFGRDFLCGLDPPVLKLKFTGPSLSEYVSVVEGNNGAASAQQRLRSADLTVSCCCYSSFFFF